MKVNPKRVKAIALYQKSIDKRLKSEYNLTEEQIDLFWRTVFAVMRKSGWKTEEATEWLLGVLSA